MFMGMLNALIRRVDRLEKAQPSPPKRRLNELESAVLTLQQEVYKLKSQIKLNEIESKFECYDKGSR